MRKIALLGLVFLAVFGKLTAKAAEEKQPNILFIYTDDHSHRTVSCYPEAFDWVDTPNIDALAANGVKFASAYIGSWCTKLYKTNDIPWWVSYRKGKWKYVRTLIEGEVEELYDLQADPEELTNLARDSAHASTVLEFRQKMVDELKRTDAGMADALPEPAELP